MSWHQTPKDDAWKRVTIASVDALGQRLWLHCACGHEQTVDPVPFADAHGIDRETDGFGLGHPKLPRRPRDHRGHRHRLAACRAGRRSGGGGGNVRVSSTSGSRCNRKLEIGSVSSTGPWLKFGTGKFPVLKHN